MKIGQLKAGVMLSYFSQLLQILITVFYTPVMIRLLGQGDYGVYQMVYGVVSFLSLMTFGFSGSYMKFYAKADKHEDRATEISILNGTFFTIFAFLGFLVLALGLWLAFNTESVLGGKLTAEELSNAKFLMFILVINSCLHFFIIVFNNFIIANERFIFLQTINVISIILNPCLTFPMLLLGYGSIGLGWTLLAITIVQLIWAIYYCVKRLHMSMNLKVFRLGLFKDIGMFSFYIFLESVISMVNISLDRFLLGKFVGSVATAVYAVGGQINTLYTSLSQTISTVFVPRINKMAEANGKDKELSDLFIKVGRIQFIILYAVLITFCVVGQRFMRIWVGTEYDESYYVAMILIIPNTVNMIQNVAYEIQRAKGLQKYRSLMYFGIAIMNILITLVLIQYYGASGAAMGTAISWVIGSGFLMNWFYKKYVKLDIVAFWRSILILTIGGLPPIAYGICIYHRLLLCNIYEYIAHVLVIIVLYAIGMFFLGVSSDERQFIKSKIKCYMKHG